MSTQAVSRWRLAAILCASLVPGGAGAAPSDPPADASAPRDPAPPVDPVPPVDPAPPPVEPDAGFVGVAGTVIDQATGEGMPAATVQVLKGGKPQELVTEIDGSFRIALPPGRYVLNFFTPQYEQQQRTVVVTRGKPATLRVELVPTAAAAEEIVIEDKIDTRSSSAALAVRRAATSVSDSISAQEIAKTPDSSAGDAVKRVVSVSVVDNRYVVLRGLEGRYVTTVLNGVPLPSPEPDRNAVPLDLFPASLLSNITVFKSYDAALPGQFAGGTLGLETNSYPTDFELKLGVSTGGTSTGTLRDGLVNGSGDSWKEFFGYPAADRALPGAVPGDAPVSRRTMDRARLEAVGESFSNVWSSQSDTYNPNLGLSAVVGDTVKLGGRSLGYLGSVSFRRGLSLREGYNRRTAVDGNGAVYATEDIAATQGKLESTIGGLLNTGYQITPDHSIEVFGLYSHVGEDLTYRAQGYSESEDTDIDLTRLQYVARQLAFAQLAGEHRIVPSRGVTLTWQGNVATTARDELDSRDIIYNQLPEGATYEDDVGSGQRYFSYLDDLSLGGGADLLVPIDTVRLKAGASYQRSTRDFSGRRFRFRFVGDDPATRRLPAEEMLSPEHIGPDFLPEETTLQEDAYDASLGIVAGYLAAEADLAPQLRVVGGVRYERAGQALANGSPFAMGGVVSTPVDRTDSDVLPTASVIFMPRPSMNVRAAYSYTLVRPRFRELAPFLYYDVTRRRDISGNPALLTTHVENTDLRWEWFPSGDEVVAASLFYKRFHDPIEQVIFNSGLDVTFQNAAGGDMAGLELEGRIGLGRITPALAPVRLGGNVAVIDSKVQLAMEDVALQTNRERPLYGQSPYVVNLSAEYVSDTIGELGVLYNVSGRRLVDVGIAGIPDTYEEAFHRLDVVASRRFGGWKLKAAVSNVLARRNRLTQDALVVNEATPGVAASIGLEWTPSAKKETR